MGKPTLTHCNTFPMTHGLSNRQGVVEVLGVSQVYKHVANFPIFMLTLFSLGSLEN